MRRTWMLGMLAVAFALAVAACDTGTDDTTTTAGSGDTTTTTLTGEVDDELSALLLDAQAQALALADDLEAMTESAALQEAWAGLLADLDTLAADVASGDGDAIRQGLDEVEAAIDEAGEEAAAEVRPAWEEFRTTMEQLLSELQM